MLQRCLQRFCKTTARAPRRGGVHRGGIHMAAAAAPEDAGTTPFPERGVLRHPDGQAVVYERLPPSSAAGRAGDRRLALILCNGLLSDRTGRKACEIRSLARASGVEAVLFDCRAHGESCTGPGQLQTLGPLDFLQDALLVLDRVVQAPTVVIAGSSLGAWVAALVALCRPQRVHGLLLLAPAVDISERHLANLTSAQRQHALQTGLVPLHSPYVSSAPAAGGATDAPAAAACPEPGAIMLGLPFFAQGAALLVLGPQQQALAQNEDEQGWLQRWPGIAEVAAAALSAGLPPPPERLPALCRVPRVHVMHGDEDDVVPLEAALGLFAAMCTGRVAPGLSTLSALAAAVPGASLEEQEVVASGGGDGVEDRVIMTRCSGTEDLGSVLWVVHGGDHRLSSCGELQHMRALLLELLGR